MCLVIHKEETFSHDMAYWDNLLEKMANKSSVNIGACKFLASDFVCVFAVFP